ncbi:hypothetical protein SLA2020_231620 [Shorea laevis]
MVRHGSFSGSGRPDAHRPLDTRPPPELLENKIAVQAAEIERLALDNRKLAAIRVALRQDIADAQQEAQNVKAHIKSTQTESDIQVRVLLDKIAKMEVDVRAGENVKKDLQQALLEAQSLVKGRQELNAQILQTSQELQKTHADLNKIPELQAELDGLRKEHQRLRATFQHEKGSNIVQVEQMQEMEKNLIGMAMEVEKLRAGVRTAEQRTHGPILPSFYGGHYVNTNPSYPPPIQGSSVYVDGYVVPPIMPVGDSQVAERIIPYGSGNIPAPAAVPGAMWGGPYNPPLA